jgi:GNAT superfamily N-acetyltransferase
MCTDTSSTNGAIYASWFVLFLLMLLSTLYPLLTFIQALDDEDNLIGVIVCKLEPHRGGPMRGYIAMLATRKDYRGHGIATSLVKMAIEKMIVEDADEVRKHNLRTFMQPLLTPFRSHSKRKSTTSHPYASTRTWVSSARSDCTGTISTVTQRFA